MTKERFDLLLIGMVALAAVVFAALYFVRAGYGLLRDGRWGPKIDNRIGWILMEAPVFLAMTALCLCSPRRNEAAPLVFFALFQLHYLHRAFIYPMLFKSRSEMPLGIVAMGIVFNLLNACMQGGWIFYVAPEDYYTNEWLLSPQFLAGTAVFFAGMAINIHSDRIIRRLRKPGDTAHYLPRGGMFRYVTSANYFGEIVEWTGFAMTDVVGLGSGVRAVDLRQPGPESGCDLQALRRAVRRRTAQRAAQARHSFHILIRDKHTSNRITFVFTMKESVLFTPGRFGPATLAQPHDPRGGVRGRWATASRPDGACCTRITAASAARGGVGMTTLAYALAVTPQRAVVRLAVGGCGPRSSPVCAHHRRDPPRGSRRRYPDRPLRQHVAPRDLRLHADLGLVGLQHLLPHPSCEACAQAKSPTWPALSARP